MDQDDSVSSKDTAVVEPSTRIFVGGLAWAATDEDLKAAFEPFGAIEAEIIRYPDTGRSRGFGFVGFGTVEEAEKAMKEMDGKELVGRAIKIGFARAKKEKQAS